MIVIDTSALVAILLKEPEASAFARAILADDEPVLSAANCVELARVMKAKRGEAALALVDELIEALRIAIAPVTPEQARLAIEAARRFPILNYGDSFAYALAKERGAPLLFKGHDFIETDLSAVTA